MHWLYYLYVLMLDTFHLFLQFVSNASALIYLKYNDTHINRIFTHCTRWNIPSGCFKDRITFNRSELEPWVQGCNLLTCVSYAYMFNYFAPLGYSGIYNRHIVNNIKHNMQKVIKNIWILYKCTIITSFADISVVKNFIWLPFKLLLHWLCSQLYRRRIYEWCLGWEKTSCVGKWIGCIIFDNGNSFCLY